MDTSIIPPLKNCITCSNEFPATREYFRQREHGRLEGECRRCTLDRNKRWRDKNPDIVKRNNAKYSATHREELREYNHRYLEEHRQENSERSKRYYEAHKDEALKHSRERYWANPAKEIEYQKLYRKAHPDRLYRQRRAYYLKVKTSESFKIRARKYTALRRARKLEAGGSYTLQDVEIQLRSQEYRCWYCQKALNGVYDLDHIVPLTRGGSNAADNIVAACPSCNRRKHNKLPQEWNGKLF